MPAAVQDGAYERAVERITQKVAVHRSRGAKRGEGQADTREQGANRRPTQPEDDKE